MQMYHNYLNVHNSIVNAFNLYVVVPHTLLLLLLLMKLDNPRRIQEKLPRPTDIFALPWSGSRARLLHFPFRPCAHQSTRTRSHFSNEGGPIYYRTSTKSLFDYLKVP